MSRPPTGLASSATPSASRAEIRALAGEDLETAFSLVCRVFVDASALHRALGVSLVAYRAHLRRSFASMVAEGLSLVAVDRASHEILGCLVARDYARRGRGGAPPGLESGLESGQESGLEPIQALLDALARPYEASTPARIGECMLVDMAVVAPAAAGRGIYRSLRERVHLVGREAGYARVVGELSSAATQHVCVAGFGHRVRSEIALASFQHAGRTPFASVREPRTIQLVEGSLR